MAPHLTRRIFHDGRVLTERIVGLVLRHALAMADMAGLLRHGRAVPSFRRLSVFALPRIGFAGILLCEQEENGGDKEASQRLIQGCAINNDIAPLQDRLGPAIVPFD